MATWWCGTRWPLPNTWPKPGPTKSSGPPTQKARAQRLRRMHSGFTALRSHCPMNIEADLADTSALIWRDQAGVRADVQRLVEMWAHCCRSTAGPCCSASSPWPTPTLPRVHAPAPPTPAPPAAASPSIAARARAARRQGLDRRSAGGKKDFLDFEEPRTGWGRSQGMRPAVRPHRNCLRKNALCRAMCANCASHGAAQVFVFDVEHLVGMAMARATTSSRSRPAGPPNPSPRGAWRAATASIAPKESHAAAISLNLSCSARISLSGLARISCNLPPGPSAARTAPRAAIASAAALAAASGAGARAGCRRGWAGRW